MLASSATRTREEYHSHSQVVSLALARNRDVALNLYRTVSGWATYVYVQYIYICICKHCSIIHIHYTNVTMACMIKI